MSRSNAVAIVALEARQAVEALPAGTSLEDRLRAAMKASRDHWMATDEGDQLMGACEAVYGLASSTERERIEADLRVMSSLSALMSGVPVAIDQIDVPENPLGIRRLWREVQS